MGDIVNLRQARKRARRAADAAEAEGNRIRHGRPKALATALAADARRAARHLDGHRLGDDGTGEAAGRTDADREMGGAPSD